MRRWGTTTVALLTALLASVARAQDPSDAIGWGDADPSESDAAAEPDAATEPDASRGSDADDAVGWGDTEAPTVEAPSPPSETRLALGGSVRGEGAMWTERLGDNGFAKARVGLDLWLRYRLRHGRLVLGAHGEYDLAYLYHPGDYNRSTRDVYQWVVRPAESFLAYDHPHVELAFGTQIVAFGHADVLSMTNVVNPLDLREPGITDPGDVRLPVLMSRAAFTSGATRLELVVLHEAWFDLRPPPLGAFSPIRELVLTHPVVVDNGFRDQLATRDLHWVHDPKRFSLESQQVFARVTTRAGSVDLGFYAFVYRDPIGTATLPDVGLLVTSPRSAIPIDHKLMETLAFSTSFAHGDFVGWLEAAVDVRRPVNVEDVDVIVDTERRTLFRWTAGLRYHGLPGAVLALEYAQGTERGPDGSNRDLFLPIVPATLLARADVSMARDRARLRLVAAATGEHLIGAGFALAEIAWLPRDGLTLALGYVSYLPNPGQRSLLMGFTRHDRLLLRFRYDFAS